MSQDASLGGPSEATVAPDVSQWAPLYHGMPAGGGNGLPGLFPFSFAAKQHTMLVE